MKAWSAMAAGMLFGVGLTLSGMSDPLKVLGFLDVSGDWIPDLALVMGGALIVSLVSTPWVLKHAAPRFASQFHVPTLRSIDQRLAIGAMLFGVGWGLSGYCPGPAIVSLLYGYESTMIFCLAMVAGMLLEDALRRSKIA
ncbi:MAG: YeeE/YedE family protein [Halieaceae bacterium]|nr:YeeE/YedE family protein [Halieaceae bacterium]